MLATVEGASKPFLEMMISQRRGRFFREGVHLKAEFRSRQPNCHSLSVSPDGTRLAVSATNANSSGNGRVKAKDSEYPVDTSPIRLWTLS